MGYPSVSRPPSISGSPLNTWLNTVFLTLSNAAQGKVNAVTDDITLTTGTVATALADPRLAGKSFIQAMPLTAAAAAAEPTLWYSGQDKGVATVNHTNSGTANRTFRFLIIG